jgi:hypothetical protein
MSSAHAGNADLNRVSLSVDASSLANAPHGNAPRRARQVAVPAVARARCTLRHVDYEDAFAVELGSARVRTAEQWARAILEGAPLAMRNGLRRSWLALGLKLDAAPPERSVLGWEVRRSTPDYVLLGADSRIGMPAELLVTRHKRAVRIATFLEHRNAAARALWATVEPAHRRIVPRVLVQAQALDR